MDGTYIPKTLVECIRYFSDPKVAHDFAVKMRWPNGVACPRCGCMDVYDIPSRFLFQCKACKKQFSVKAGSVFEDSRVSLDKWLVATWMLTGAKNGVSSCEIARALDVTQKTAWFLLHRIRTMLETGSMEKLDGEVEADETWIGQKSKTMHSKKRAEMRERGFPKTCVFGLKERDGEVRTMVIPDTTKDTLHAAIDANVEQDATVFTDTARGYIGLSDRYEHETVDHSSGQYVREMEDERKAHINGMENYWSLLDRMGHGTYTQMSPQHQHRYLAEEDFRYNSRKDKDGERFVKALRGMNGKRLTYDQLTTSHLQTMERA